MARIILPPLPRTLILDYYDSYTNNLLTLFTQLYPDEEVLQKVVVVKADKYSWDEFQNDILPGIDCVILSPGPGRPDNPTDIGFALDLLRLHPLPILGVCLGHQAIGVAFGGQIINTPRITHGHVVPIFPVTPAKGLFASPTWNKYSGSEDSFEVVVYNSLTVDPDTLPDDLVVTAWSAPTIGTATIQGLAHREYPIWGVQYHPESISSTRGAGLLHSFLDEVHRYHADSTSYPPLSEDIISACAYRKSHSQASSSRCIQPRSPESSSAKWSGSALSAVRLVEQKFGSIGKSWKTQDVFERVVRGSDKGKQKAGNLGEIWLDGETPSRPTTTSLSIPNLIITYSLSSRTITLHKSDRSIEKLRLEGGMTFWEWFSDGQKALENAVLPADSVISNLTAGAGWKAGWVGWFGYEMKEESLEGYRRRASVTLDGDAEKIEQVDACWAWSSKLLERSEDGEWIARGVLSCATNPEPKFVQDALMNGINKSSGLTGVNGAGTFPSLFKQSNSSPVASSPIPSLVSWLQASGVQFGISESDYHHYLSEIEDSLTSSEARQRETPAASFPTFHPITSGSDYQARIDKCREAIRQGESYELTLTTQFQAAISQNESAARSSTSASDPFYLYLRLRAYNPAYYSSYMSFPTIPTPRGKGIHVLSSSPERFLRVVHSAESRNVEMKPIKGTRARVKIGECVCDVGKGCEGRNKGSEECLREGRRVDVLRGEELRSDEKERAENLMIVDLIRSDLLASCVPSSVKVPQLIALETYGVHNLVTTVSGILRDDVGGLEAVQRCFPPGSMTGAPKLRSVQLLDGLEGGVRRGIYSGALGYISLCGAVDLSVVIRTIIVEGNRLTLGAGGAITWLSDREEEWQEVLTKVKSVVGTLEGL